MRSGAGLVFFCNATIIKEISFKVTLSWSIPFLAQAALICSDYEPYELF